MNRLQRAFIRLKPVHAFIEWTKVTVLRGFSPLPIYTIATFFFREIARESLATKASSLAYNFMLAIFPGSIFLCTLIPYIPITNFQDGLLELIKLVLPENAFMAVKSTLEEIIKKQNGGLLSFGFVTALFFATNGLHGLMKAFNKSSLTLESRSWLKQRLVALALTLVTVTALIMGLGIITIGEYILSVIRSNTPDFHLKESFWTFLIDLGKWFILVCVYFITISILYRYGPATAKKWRLFSAGAWMATTLALLTFWGFAIYISNFTSYNKLYGSIGTLIVVMVWLYINSLIILVGFELNASIDLSKRSIRIVKPKFNSFKEPVDEKFEGNRLKNL
ncbi:YihY/virulence factor BrkB family protein [Hufsiella ginkgonis]|uniref:YihY family inner membrane protein n=1 Tax=Hufsiella ginkgonis TaxID=2695274 RepID=A0A7K1Y0F7_9SPHI|nr:YihY/virulence factor BrkB family protein [Hufsiella ginkgonis]MXV16567.1 YihY family inner membrane protein [Hufsiella ginkgonis]